MPKPSIRTGGGTAPRRVVLLGYEGVAGLDLSGVLDAFYIAGRLTAGGRAGYETLVAGFSSAPFRSEAGLRMAPDVALADCPQADTIVLPGGSGLRRPEAYALAGSWIGARKETTRRFVSVCTGVYGLAASGLLDGRRATTHWRFAADAARRFPRVTFEANAIFIKDGPCYSSAGMTAGIDLALALIEEDHGPAVALATARTLVVYMKRSGGQLQYSEPLQSQVRGGDRIADLIARMLADLGADWSVETMARESGFSPRQFSRRFKAALGSSPASHLEILRLDAARQRLAGGRESIARIAHAVGFSSDDAFRRAFERRFGVSPTSYRARFAGPSGAHRSGVDHDFSASS